MAQVFIYHQEQPKPSTPAGFFLPKRVASFTLDGMDTVTIFANLVGVSNQVFRDIERARSP